MDDKTVCVIVGIFSLTLLETTALIKGIDGVFFGAIIAAISTLAGLLAGHVITKKEIPANV